MWLRFVSIGLDVVLKSVLSPGMMKGNLLVHLFEAPSPGETGRWPANESYRCEGPSLAGLCFSSETVLWLIRLVHLWV